MTSVSEVDWQMAPEEISSRRSVRALVRLPLWATREAAGVEVGEQRLHVAQDGVAGGGVAVVAERDVALAGAPITSALLKLSPTRPRRRSEWKWLPS